MRNTKSDQLDSALVILLVIMFEVYDLRDINMLSVEYIVPAGFSSRPSQRASVEKLMDIMESSGDAYVDRNGTYIDPYEDVGQNRISETRDKFFNITKQIKESMKTHMPLVALRGGKPCVTNGRHRIAVLASLGVGEVDVVADEGVEDEDVELLWSFIRA